MRPVSLSARGVALSSPRPNAVRRCGPASGRTPRAPATGGGGGGGRPPRPPRRPPAAAAGGGGDGGGGGGEAFASRSSGPPSLLRLVALGVGLAAAAVAAAPAALSTRPGTRFLCWLLSRALGGRVAVTADRVTLAWTKPPEVAGLTVTPRAESGAGKAGKAGGGSAEEEEGAPVLELGRGSATASLAAIAFTRRRFDVVLSQPYLDLFLAPDGRGTRLERALGGPRPPRPGEGGGGEDDDAAAAADAEAFGPTRPDPGPDPSAALGPPVPQPFSAEVRAGRVGVYVADGVARVPADAREVVTGGAAPPPPHPSALGRLLGRHGAGPALPGPVHAAVLVGAAALEEDGEGLGWDGRAWDDPGGDPAAGAAVLVRGARRPARGSPAPASSSSSSSSSYDASWARSSAGRPRAARAPVAATLVAPGLRAQASGWIAGGGAFAASPAAAAAGLARGWLARATGKEGRGKDGKRRPRHAWSLHLRDPGLAVAAACTPALARSGLARLSPLLADAVGVQDAACVRVAVRPDGGALPASGADVRVAALKLRLGAGDSGGSGGGDGSGRPSAKNPPPALSRRLLRWLGSTTSARLPRDGVIAWTAPVTVRAGPSGLTIPRFDLLLTTPDGAAAAAAAVAAADAAAAAGAALPPPPVPAAAARGVHLVTWGAVDPGGRRVALTVGVPGSTLRSLGVRGVRPGALLPISVRGPLARPAVDFVGASARLAALVAAGAAEGGGGEAEGGGAGRPAGAAAALAAVRRALGRGVERRADGSRGGSGGGGGPASLPSSLPWEVGGRLVPDQIGLAKKKQAAAAAAAAAAAVVEER